MGGAPACTLGAGNGALCEHERNMFMQMCVVCTLIWPGTARSFVWLSCTVPSLGMNQ